MWAAIQGPFVVGLVRWQWPKPGITVIVKSTFALGGAARATVSPLQLGLATDHRGMGPSDQELEFASDFVPLKAHCDVLVVGHARSPRPVESLLVGIDLDHQLSKRVTVMSREHGRRAPLVSRATFCEGGQRRLAPRPAPTHGWQLLDSMTDFDFGRCNVAPLDQQLTAIRAEARLVLTGLIGDGRPRDLRLAGLEPEAWYVPVGSPSPAPRPVPLRCDTLWIHGDRKICTLTWRGTVELDPAALTTAQLAVQPAGTGAAAPADTADVEWKAVVEAHQVAPGPPAQLPLSEAAQRIVAQQAAARDNSDAVATPVAAQGSARASGAPPPGASVRGPATEVLRADHFGITAADLSDDSPRQPSEPPPKRPERGGTRVLAAPLPPETAADEAEGDDDVTEADDAGPGSEPPESEEPAPITPRAGVMLGGLGGASLGSAVLTAAPSSANALPFGGESRSTDPEASVPSAQRDSEPSVPPRASSTAPPAAASAGGSASSPQSSTGQVLLAEAQRGALPFRGSSPPPPAQHHSEPSAADRASSSVPPPAGSSSVSAPAPESSTGEILLAEANEEPLPFSGSSPPPPPLQPAPSPFADETLRAAPGAAASKRTQSMPAFAPATAPDSLPSGWSTPPPTGSTPPPAPSTPPPPIVPAMASSPPPPIVPTVDPLAARQSAPPPAPDREPDPDVPLGLYGTIKAALQDDNSVLGELLERHDIGEQAWRANERRLIIELAREKRQGDDALARSLQQAIDEALAAQAEPAPEPAVPELDEYVALRIELEAAPDLGAAFEERQLRAEDWARWKRCWTERCEQDAALGSELRARLSRARQAHRKGAAG